MMFCKIALQNSCGRLASPAGWFWRHKASSISMSKDEEHSLAERVIDCLSLRVVSSPGCTKDIGDYWRTCELTMARE
jgi:hypothetical protein